MAVPNYAGQWTSNPDDARAREVRRARAADAPSVETCRTCTERGFDGGGPAFAADPTSRCPGCGR